MKQKKHTLELKFTVYVDLVIDTFIIMIMTVGMFTCFFQAETKYDISSPHNFKFMVTFQKFYIHMHKTKANANQKDKYLCEMTYQF